MKKMSFKLLCFLLNLSLVFTPAVSMANNGQGQFNRSQTITDITQGISQVGGLLQSTGLMGGSQQMGNLTFVAKTHTEGFLGRKCKVFNAKGDRPFEPYCQVGDPQSQVEAEKLQRVAQENVNTFQNYLARQAPGTLEGMTCLEDGLKDMENILLQREKQLTEMKNKINELRTNFETQAELDKRNIEKLQNLIDGKNIDENELATLYNKAFNDKQCRSIFVDDSGFKSAARDGVSGKKGLNGLMAHIENQKRGPIPGAGEQGDLADYIRKNQGTIRKDIKTTATKLKDYLGNVGVSQIDSGSKAGGFESEFTSQFNIQDSSVFKEVINNSYANYSAERTNLGRQVKKLGMSSDPIAMHLQDPDVNFDDELQKWENREYTKCINRQMFGNNSAELSSSDVDAFVGKFRSNNSRLGNRSTRGHDLQEYIATVLGDNDIPLKERISRIKTYAQKKGYSDIFFFGSGSVGPLSDVDKTSEEIQEQGTRDTKQVHSVASLFDGYRASCERIFKSRDRDGSNYSTDDIITNLKKLRKSYDKTVNNYQKDVHDDLIDRMINCKGTPEVNSCDRSQLNFEGNSSFCLKNAITCSVNMKSCEKKVQDVINDKLKEKQKISYQYNKNFNNFTKQNKQLFQAMENQVKDMAKLYTRYFPSPPDMPPVDYSKLPLKEPQVVFDQNLQVDMTDERQMKEYINNLNARYDLLIKSVQDQNKKLVAEGRDRVKVIEQQINQEMGFWSKVASTCSGAVDNFIANANTQNNNAYQEQQKQAMEVAKDVGVFCQKYNAVAGAEHPGAGCGLAKDLYEDAAKVVARLSPSDINNVEKMEKYCNSFNNEDEGSGNTYYTVPSNYVALEIKLDKFHSDLLKLCEGTGNDSKQKEALEFILKQNPDINCVSYASKHAIKDIEVDTDNGNGKVKKISSDFSDYADKFAQAIAVYNRNVNASSTGDINLKFSDMGESDIALCTAQVGEQRGNGLDSNSLNFFGNGNNQRQPASWVFGK